MFGSVSFSNRNLYDTICSKEKLPLHQRLSIAVQCAEGLVHIHSLAAENPDSCSTSLLGKFRSANIFLDKNFVPKIFNVNLSTCLGVSVAQKNTVFPIHDNEREKFYSDPRDISGQLFNKKSDVYSFGVVLLELITWKTVRYRYNGGAHVLTRDFLDSYRRDHNAIEIFGKVCYEHEGYFVHEAIAIAMDCLQLDIQMRPGMDYVLSLLRIIASRSKFVGTRNKISSHILYVSLNLVDTHIKKNQIEPVVLKV
jgi:serine/threonine protein kinase